MAHPWRSARLRGWVRSVVWGHRGEEVGVVRGATIAFRVRVRGTGGQFVPLSVRSRSPGVQLSCSNRPGPRTIGPGRLVVNKSPRNDPHLGFGAESSSHDPARTTRAWAPANDELAPRNASYCSLPSVFRTTQRTPITVRAERQGCATQATTHGRQTNATSYTGTLNAHRPLIWTSRRASRSTTTSATSPHPGHRSTSPAPR